MTRFLPVLFLSLLAGCPVYGPESEPPPPTRGEGLGGSPGGTGNCSADTDCPIGSLCEPDSGRCFDVSRCVTDGDCPPGSYCDEPSGDCVVPDIAMCSDASGAGGSGGDGGGSGTECEAGFECDFRDSCRPTIPGYCTADDICGDDELCIEERCVASASACTEDAHCAVGATCQSQRCVFLCDEGAACPSGTECDGTLCQPTTGECADSSDCPDLRTNCVTGRCLFRCTEGCDDRTEVCDDEGFCRPRTLPDPEAVAPLCTEDNDCNESVCVEGTCRASCEPTDEDANATCEAFDGQLPICGADGYCYAE